MKYKVIGDFYRNRLLRIFPTYWLVFSITILIQSLLDKPNQILQILSNEAFTLDAKILLIFSNIFIFGSDIMMFLYQGNDGLKFTANFQDHLSGALWTSHAIPQAWSLPVELYFYAIAPWIVKSIKTLLRITVFSLLARIAFYFTFFSHDPWSYRFFPFELGLFCLGGLAYWIHAKIEIKITPFTGKMIGTVLLGITITMILNFDVYRALFRFIPQVSDYVSGGSFLLLLALSTPFIFKLCKSIKADLFIGELSYPIYITHILFVKYANSLISIFNDKVLNVIFYTCASALLIQIIFQIPIEKTFKRDTH